MEIIGGFMRQLTLIITIAMLISHIAVAYAQTEQVYFKFEISSRQELVSLTKIISIDNVEDKTVYAYATDRQFDHFKTLGYDYTILPGPGSLISPRMADSREAILEWDSYPTYREYTNIMLQFEIDYPDLCIIDNIGYSVEGRDILFAKLSANVNIEENEPEVMYSSTMHGDETTGYVLMLRLIDYLLSNYGTNPQVTNILDSMEVWINPLANPDGTYHGGDNTVEDAIRFNANGVDLNRNFPDPDEGPHPDGNDWQPETIAMMNFFDQHSFDISANFHGGAEVVNYPWDTWPQRHADDAWFIQISREYADSAQANSPLGYMTDLNNGITNGWDWYTIAGGRQDYLNFWKGCREVTIELSHVKLLPPEQLPDYWDYNRAAFLTYWEQVYYGIKGTVTDAITGFPVAATISVIDHDIDSSEVYTDPDIGDYHRMIEPGTYDLRFTAPGYIPLIVYGVTATFRNITIVDVQLQPVPDEPILEFYAHNAGIVNAGDTVSMSITLINHGGGNAYNVNATLSTSDGYIDILQSNSTYPTITALGGTGTSYTDYQFAISPDCPDYYLVDFQLDITASGGYSNTSHFDFVVGDRETIFSDDFSLNQGWTGLGGPAEWTIGVATGGYGSDTHGGPDPALDHSPGDDNQVLGNDLNPGSGGDYNANISTTYWITSPIIDCTDYTGVIMTYYRWLGTERNQYDHAYLQAFDGSNWVTLFENPSTTIDESSWNEKFFDLSDIADENPNFQIRYGLGTTDGGWQYCGWNIDDLTLEGYFHGTTEYPDISIWPTSIDDSLSQYSQAIHDITIYNNGNAILSVTFSTEESWIQFDGGPYNIDPEDNAIFQVTLNTDNLPPGDYSGSINFTSNDPDTPTGNIPVSLHVLEPDISFSPDVIIDSLYEDSMSVHDITIYNNGEGILFITFSSDDSWIGFDGDSYYIDPADSASLQVTLDATDLSPEDYSGSIDFTSNDPDTLFGGIPVTLTVMHLSSGCDYIPGDINGDGDVMGNDVTFGVRYFKGIGSPPPDSCWNDSTDSWLYSAGDANGNCCFTGSDITFLVAYFKGSNPEILWCPQTPPVEPPLQLKKNETPTIINKE
jgi:hypothetical protein